MKKNTVVLLIVGLLVIGGGGYWWYTSRGGGFTGTLLDALNSGRALSCTAEIEGETSTFFVKGGKLRGGATYDGQDVEYLFRDNCFYYWVEDESQGIKMCWEGDEAEQIEENLASASQQWNCRSASVPNSTFDLPSGIEFIDLGSYME